VTSCADLLDLLLHARRRAARDYVEGTRTAKPALKPFIASLAAQESEQADALAELGRRGDLERLFRAPGGEIPVLPARTAQQADPGAAANPLDLALRNCDAWIAALAFLESHAADTEVAQALARLAGEARRTRIMVASRLDLETLGGT
jgi:hypothetical protein